MGKDEAPKVYAVEGTPQNFSETNSILSVITMDDHASDLSKLSKGGESSSDSKDATVIEQVTDKSFLDQSDDKEECENSSMSEMSDGDEDILKQCINIAMPRKMRRSSSDNALKKKSTPKESHGRRLGMKLGEAPGPAKGVLTPPKSKRIAMTAPATPVIHGEPEDTVKSYATEDLPEVSKVTNISKSSTPYTQGKKPVPLPKPTVSKGNNSSIAKGGNSVINTKPQNIVQPVIQCVSGGIERANKPKPLMFREILHAEAEHMECDTLQSYATEDTPLVQSAAVSPTGRKRAVEQEFSMNIVDRIDVCLDDDAVKPFAVEDTPYVRSSAGSPTPHDHPPSQQVTVPEPIPPEAETTTSYATEDTPVNFSSAGSLSDLSCITNITGSDFSPRKKVDLTAQVLADKYILLHQ